MEDMYIGDGTDMVHDHLTLGIRSGCVACAQLEADFARAHSVTARVHSASRANAARSRATLASSAAGAGTRTERDD